MNSSSQIQFQSDFVFNPQESGRQQGDENRMGFPKRLHSRRQSQSRSQPTRQGHSLSQTPNQIPSYITPYNSQLIEIQELIRMLGNYNPVSQLVSMETLKRSPTAIIKKYRQAAYFGEVTKCDDKKNGLGIMLYTNGRVYQGEWSQNLKQGKGYQKFQNGSIYFGGYIKGKPEGFGKYQWPNGQVYEGEWIDGLKTGSGIWRGSKGDSYIGQWKNGKADGYGVHTWVNGDRYQGQFQDCLKHGEGLQKFSNGDSYKGNYQNGKPCGYGQYYWSSGSFFKGDFLNGLRNGSGVWKRGPGNSDKYQGLYKNDKKQGQGIFTWANGNAYKGNYIEDLRDGYGEMTWSDGSCYKGMWAQGVQQQSSQKHYQNELFIKVTSKAGKNAPEVVSNVGLGAESNFFEFEERQNNYNQPEAPLISEKSINRRPFRARGVTSHKSSRDKSVKVQTPQSRIYLHSSSFHQQPRLNKKYSMGSRIDINSKKKSHQRFSSSSCRDHHSHLQSAGNDHHAMSASFFLYNIHNGGKSYDKHHHSQYNSNPNVNIASSQNHHFGVYQPRQIKTSGAFRQKRIAEEIKYFTKNKFNDVQFL